MLLTLCAGAAATGCAARTRRAAPNASPPMELVLPDANGHDLVPVPATSRLFISTGQRGWYFDRHTRQLAPHDLLAETAEVKSYSIHRSTGRIACAQAEGNNWWAERVHFLKLPGVLYLPGQRLYKARWP
jgi:hypothetical protein